MKRAVRAVCILMLLVMAIHVTAIPAFASETQELPKSSASNILKIFLEENVNESSPKLSESAEPEEETEEKEEKETKKESQETSGGSTADQHVSLPPNNLPLFFQNDYPNTMYGSGTVESSGCSITALAMVATFMTDHEYLPDELAKYFGGKAINNIERLEYASEALKLPFSRAENWHFARQALREGKVVIALMNEKSIFTESQHFIVITGINEDGRYLVNDPYAPNYENWELQYGFENGFIESDIWRGYSGAWIYDKSAMPEEPFIYHVDEPYVEPRYPDIILRKEDRQLLAKMVWVEARGESFEGQQAVAEVVLNRMFSDNFPDTLEGVIYAENQFRSTKFLDTAEPYQTQYEAIERALKGPYVLPIDVVHFATYPVNDNVWGQIGGHIFCYAE